MRNRNLKLQDQTTRCIRCKKAAKLWTGFIEDANGRPVLAGWCSHRCIKAWESCHGYYLAWMGKARAD